MLLLILKITIVFSACLLTMQLLKVNSSNFKQKIIVVTFAFCLLVPFLSQLPLSFNLNTISTIQTQHKDVFLIPQSDQSIQFKNSKHVISTNINQAHSVARDSQQSPPIDYLWVSILILWLCGFIFKLFSYLAQIYQLIVLVNRAELLKAPSIKSLKRLNHSKAVNHLISNKTEVPFLFVTFKAINIVFPKQSQYWSEQDIHNVIAHEICHYRRKDHWALCLSSVAAILYWFHPLLSRLIKCHKEMIELACDQQLISEGMNATLYAETILSIAQAKQKFSTVPFMSSNPSSIKKRIHEILQHKHSKVGIVKINLLILLLLLVSFAGCMNNNTLLSSANLVEFISNDLSSLRSGKLDNNHIQIATFYDGVDKQTTYLELELSKVDNPQTTWLKLGPLKKFNYQIQTWHYKTIKEGELTGRYKVSNAIADGSVDGVAFGIIYADNKGKTIAHKSVGPFDNRISNILCSWPLDIANNKYKELTPQISNDNHETIKRLLCGSQLLKNGVYSIN